jgi:hypothetical protein
VHLENLGINGRTVLRRIVWRWMALYGSGQGHVVGCCEDGNEPSVCMKLGDFFTICGAVAFSRKTAVTGMNCSLWTFPKILSVWLLFFS